MIKEIHSITPRGVPQSHILRPVTGFLKLFIYTSGVLPFWILSSIKDQMVCQQSGYGFIITRIKKSRKQAQANMFLLSDKC